MERTSGLPERSGRTIDREEFSASGKIAFSFHRQKL
jgi:hypothetical protein